jgi:predicted dehydrogenase
MPNGAPPRAGEINIAFQNSFRSCREAFLRHVADDAPFAPTLLEGDKGVQLADLSYRSSRERRWVDVPELVL